MIKIIGLVDYDLFTGVLKTPNVEIMKLASYYKTEEGQFCRLLRLEEEPSLYDKIFFFSEKGNCSIPDSFKKSKNVVYGGTGFTKGIYIPFEKELIDYTVPNPIIYKDYLREEMEKSLTFKEVNDFLDNTYHRMYAGNKKLIVPPTEKRKKIFLYDRDFFWETWEKDIEELLKGNPSSLNRIHPIYCDSFDKLLAVKRIKKMLSTTEIILTLPIKFNEIVKIIKQYEKYLLEFINLSSCVYLPIGQNCKNVLQYYSSMVFTLNFLYSFWARKIPIKVKAIMSDDCPVKELLLAIENWSSLSQEKKRNTTLEEVFYRPQNKKIKEQYKNFLKFHPKENILFKKTYRDLEKGGFWRIC